MKLYTRAYTFLTVSVVLALIIVALGFVWAQAIPGQPRLVCTINGEVVFDHPVDHVERTSNALMVTLNGQTQAIVVPEGMECK